MAVALISKYYFISPTIFILLGTYNFIYSYKKDNLARRLTSYMQLFSGILPALAIDIATNKTTPIWLNFGIFGTIFIIQIYLIFFCYKAQEKRFAIERLCDQLKYQNMDYQNDFKNKSRIEQIRILKTIPYDNNVNKYGYLVETDTELKEFECILNKE